MCIVIRVSVGVVLYVCDCVYVGVSDYVSVSKSAYRCVFLILTSSDLAYNLSLPECINVHGVIT